MDTVPCASRVQDISVAAPRSSLLSLCSPLPTVTPRNTLCGSFNALHRVLYKKATDSTWSWAPHLRLPNLRVWGNSQPRLLVTTAARGSDLFPWPPPCPGTSGSHVRQTAHGPPRDSASCRPLQASRPVESRLPPSPRASGVCSACGTAPQASLLAPGFV